MDFKVFYKAGKKKIIRDVISVDSSSDGGIMLRMTGREMTIPYTAIKEFSPVGEKKFTGTRIIEVELVSGIVRYENVDTFSFRGDAFTINKLSREMIAVYTMNDVLSISYVQPQ